MFLFIDSMSCGLYCGCERIRAAWDRWDKGDFFGSGNGSRMTSLR